MAAKRTGKRYRADGFDTLGDLGFEAGDALGLEGIPSQGDDELYGLQEMNDSINYDPFVEQKSNVVESEKNIPLIALEVEGVFIELVCRSQLSFLLKLSGNLAGSYQVRDTSYVDKVEYLGMIIDEYHPFFFTEDYLLALDFNPALKYYAKMVQEWGEGSLVSVEGDLEVRCSKSQFDSLINMKDFKKDLEDISPLVNIVYALRSQFYPNVVAPVHSSKLNSRFATDIEIDRVEFEAGLDVDENGFFNQIVDSKKKSTKKKGGRISLASTIAEDLGLVGGEDLTPVDNDAFSMQDCSNSSIAEHYLEQGHSKSATQAYLASQGLSDRRIKEVLGIYSYLARKKVEKEVSGCGRESTGNADFNFR